MQLLAKEQLATNLDVLKMAISPALHIFLLAMHCKQDCCSSTHWPLLNLNTRSIILLNYCCSLVRKRRPCQGNLDDAQDRRPAAKRRPAHWLGTWQTKQIGRKWHLLEQLILPGLRGLSGQGAS